MSALLRIAVLIFSEITELSHGPGPEEGITNIKISKTLALPSGPTSIPMPVWGREGQLLGWSLKLPPNLAVGLAYLKDTSEN